ncbi:MAG: TonB-dependent receptor [Burkholderiales bacterium]
MRLFLCRAIKPSTRCAMRRPLALLALIAPLGAVAQPVMPDGPAPTVGTLREVIVTTPRGSAPSFQVPASIDRVDGEQLRDGKLQVNLSESLGAVPGLQIQNRQNYAQDLQLSIRGFGARSTFGVRGVRLYVDGIPATMPDGQGQTSNIDINSVDRIEVLRGPFSALYGNSSGGVVQVFTERGDGPPKIDYSIAGGSFGSLRQSLKVSGSSGVVDYVLSGSHFRTDGFRDHSAATRDIVNGKLGINLSDGSRVTVIVNSVRIDAQDPLGLTAAQLAENRRGAALATQYDTRKTVDQQQLGMLFEKRIDRNNDLRVMAYGGQREIVQYLSVPPAAQRNPTQSGGVIDLNRDYAGIDVRWTTRQQLAGRPFELAGGLAYETLREKRLGYENFTGTVAAPTLGVQGRLRRDERNDVYSLDPYLQASWQVADRWTVEAGLRYSTVHFKSEDRYVVVGNGDDSGSAQYKKLLPLVAVRYAATKDIALYATAGRGFETPTFNELSYRPGGLSGLNFGLQPSVNNSFEIGAKARISGGLLTAALFTTRTEDEIVVDTNVGGRSTFQNAGRTRRNGLELGWLHETPGYWRTQLAYTLLDAKYRDAFCSPSPCAADNRVPAGNRIPGIAKQSAFASFGLLPPQGFRASAEVRALSRIQANDENSAGAPGYAVVGIQGGYLLRWNNWQFNAFARIDNLFDRDVIGSVIVNEGNNRYFEPAPGRNWTVGFGAIYRF